MNRDHKLKAGHVAVASFTNSDIIRNFPRQSDQALWHPWHVNLTTPPRPVRMRFPLSRTKKADGAYRFEFIFDHLTYGMYDYLIDTFIDPGATGAESANVTIMVYDRADVAVYMQGILHSPNTEPNKTPIGVRDAVFSFVDGVIIT